MASAVANLHSGNNARFNAEALSWDSRPFVHEASAGAARAIRARLDKLQRPEGGYEVLEIGCGTGILSFMLARDERVRRIVAVDAAEGMINVLKTKVEKDKEVGEKIVPLAILLEDAEDMALPPAATGNGRQKFDLITSHLVLHHIPDLKCVLETMYGCLARGGFVMLTDFENVSAESQRFHPASKMDGVARHGINAKEMTELMEGVGFQDVDVRAHWTMDKTVEKYEGEFGREDAGGTNVGETMQFPFVFPAYGNTIGSWRRLWRRLPRWAHVPLFVTLLGACIGLVRGISDLHDQHVKQYPTDFSFLHFAANETLALPPPEQPLRYAHASHIDEKYTYLRHLGHGQEGSAALYADLKSGDVVVAKTFTSIARNPLPAILAEEFKGLATTWPSEIEAGISLSNHLSGFVPVYDYFVLQTEDLAHAWTMISPFLSNGTLESFATREGSTSHISATRLDEYYRPALDRVLRSLHHLHRLRLCHDDIKPDNFFVKDALDWLLGDLGNLRHIGHQWHNTRSWVRQNQWRDCRLNDIRRALKSYLWFLRTASVDTRTFDQAFWSRNEAWAEMYWHFDQSATGIPTSHQKRISGKDEVSLAADTERELLCTGVPRRLWTWWDFLLWY
ncbi:hypothetical protein AC578_7017 [Pseudocercospora eumusae]|uniref:Protein kinase domain-containing protein n=1 Tax=Pseudocercospora eumusae TaxID=321146 RepID=A0A139HCM7_9PEZI|nr:hypothetical protein AC578_7017 [Pseudocercospora eumusae]